MKHVAPVGRNEPCPCGSGKKYKACCALKVERVVSADVPAPRRNAFSWQLGVFVVLFLGLGAVAAVQMTSAKPAEEKAAAAPLPRPMPMPKIEFAPENGAPGVLAGANAAAPQPAPQFTPGPQPAGPVPPGKVWSPEHGHWHDQITTTTQLPVSALNGGGIPMAPASAPAPATAPVSTPPK